MEEVVIEILNEITNNVYIYAVGAVVCLVACIVFIIMKDGIGLAIAGAIAFILIVLFVNNLSLALKLGKLIEKQ